MSFSKIASYVLYIVVGITIPILILFYFGDNMVNTETYQAKIQKIENPVKKSTGPNVVMDMQSADSLANDSAKVANIPAVVEEITPVVAEEVSFTFMEKLVYYKMDIAIIWGYFLLLIAAITAVVFPIAYAIVHPANLVRSLLLLVGVAVLIGVSYLLSSGETLEIIGYTGTDNSNPGILKLIDTGLIFNYFILGLALLSIVYAEIAKYFK
jgi:hypothetical protein